MRGQRHATPCVQTRQSAYAYSCTSVVGARLTFCGLDQPFFHCPSLKTRHFQYQASDAPKHSLVLVQTASERETSSTERVETRHWRRWQARNKNRAGIVRSKPNDAGPEAEVFRSSGRKGQAKEAAGMAGRCSEQRQERMCRAGRWDAGWAASKGQASGPDQEGKQGGLCSAMTPR